MTRKNIIIIGAAGRDFHNFNTYFREDDFVAQAPESWGGNVFHHRRILKDGQLYFFTYYDKDEMAQISFEGLGKMLNDRIQSIKNASISRN